ncbi:MAG: TIGR02444 family protein [Dongiaceae bacterium]
MTDIASKPANPFWDFSLALYGRPEVAPALLGLQDRCGVDVNLLLYCCWQGSIGQYLSPADLAAARDATALWQHDVVHPIRAARRRLKAGFQGLSAESIEALRRRLGDIEIEAERIAQDAMVTARPLASTAIAAGAAIAANLKACVSRAEIPIDPASAADLTAILRGCVPDADLAELDFAS